MLTAHKLLRGIQRSRHDPSSVCSVGDGAPCHSGHGLLSVESRQASARLRTHLVGSQQGPGHLAGWEAGGSCQGATCAHSVTQPDLEFCRLPYNNDHEGRLFQAALHHENMGNYQKFAAQMGVDIKQQRAARVMVL